jgi:hypothetical protein
VTDLAKVGKTSLTGHVAEAHGVCESEALQRCNAELDSLAGLGAVDVVTNDRVTRAQEAAIIKLVWAALDGGFAVDPGIQRPGGGSVDTLQRVEELPDRKRSHRCQVCCGAFCFAGRGGIPLRQLGAIEKLVAVA